MDDGDVAMNAAIKESLTPEEKQRLVSFFQVLIQIDRRERITPTARQRYKKRAT